MSNYEKVKLTNMCMIYDNDGNVVVQDKINKSWGGITFPGGHIEKQESFVDSVVREVKEETGLKAKAAEPGRPKSFIFRILGRFSPCNTKVLHRLRNTRLFEN